MKIKWKVLIIASSIILVVILMIGLFILGMNPFVNWENNIKDDYDNHLTIFGNIVISTDSSFRYIKNDDYANENSDYYILFEELDYLFISGNKEELFFCKTIDGMNAIGIKYVINSNWTAPPKGKIIKVLDNKGHWYLYSENYL